MWLQFVALDTPDPVDGLDSTTVSTKRVAQEANLHVKQPVLDFSLPGRRFLGRTRCLSSI